MEWQKNVDLSRIRFYPTLTRESTSINWIMENEIKLKNKIKYALYTKGLGHVDAQEIYDDFLASFMNNSDMDFNQAFSDDPEYCEEMYIISRLNYFIMSVQNRIIRKITKEFSLINDDNTEDKTPSYTININKIEDMPKEDIDSFKYIELRADMKDLFGTLIYYSVDFGFDLIDYFTLIFKKESRSAIARKLNTKEENLVGLEKALQDNSKLSIEIHEAISSLIMLCKLESISFEDLVEGNKKIIEELREIYATEEIITEDENENEETFDSYMERLFKNSTAYTTKEQMVGSVIEAIGCGIVNNNKIEEMKEVS